MKKNTKIEHCMNYWLKAHDIPADALLDLVTIINETITEDYTFYFSLLDHKIIVNSN